MGLKLEEDLRPKPRRRLELEGIRLFKLDLEGGIEG